MTPMPRPPTTLTPNQRALLKAAADAHTKTRHWETQYRERLQAAAAAGVPISHLADALGTERKTIYRHLDSR